MQTTISTNAKQSPKLAWNRRANASPIRGPKVNHPTYNRAREQEHAAEVLKWCRHLNDQQASLFTEALSPQVALAGIMLQSGSWPLSIDRDTMARIRVTVDEVSRRRQELLTAATSTPKVAIGDRRLVYYPDLTDFCELGIETGIVDYADTPAWDLWTATASHEQRLCVVCYVPAWLHARADHAIALSPTGALAWCDVEAISWHDPV